MPLIGRDANDYGSIDADFSLIDSELDAVNVCMRAIGREGVDSLDSGDLDAEDARRALHIASQRIQYNKGTGWWFNLEPNWHLTPDSNGEVLLPNNCLSVHQCYCKPLRKKIPMTMRAGKLYSTWNHTFDMRGYVGENGSLDLTLVMLLPFEHLPPTAMQVITYQAAAEFIVSKDADQLKLNTVSQIANELMMQLQSEQMSQKRLNMFIHNRTQGIFGALAGGSSNLPSFDRSPYNVWPTYLAREE